MSIAPKYLDFGEVVSKDDFKWTVRLQNDTPDQLDISSFESSCSCTSVQPQRVVIAPKSLQDIVLSLNLTAHEPSEALAPTREFQVTVIPHIRTWSGPLPEFPIHGRVRDLIRWSPGRVSLTANRGVKNEVSTVKLTLLTKVRGITAECSPGDAQVSIAGFDRPVDEFAEGTLRITPTGDRPAGPFSFPVTLRVVPSDEHLESQTVEIPVFGRAVDDVIAIPPAVTLGQIRIGETKTDFVSLLSQSGRPFRIVSVDPDSKTEALVIKSIEGGHAPYRFAVSQVAKTLGSGLARARFRILYDGADKLTLVELPISYFGVPRTDQSPARASLGEK